MIASERDSTCILFGPSLIELIARPEVYDGKPVRAIGFANLGFEDNGLYVSREDVEQMIAHNGVWLDAPDSLARHHRSHLPGYFIVQGVFAAGNRAHFGMWSGAIERVSRFEPVRSRASIDSMLKRSVGR